MKIKRGTITSAKMDKTIVVSVYAYESDPKYKKRYRTTKKFYAHDENNSYKEGDVVTIKEVKPLSKLKRWEVLERK